MLQIWNALKFLLLKHSAERQREGQADRIGMDFQRCYYKTNYLTPHRCKCDWVHETWARGDPAVFYGDQ
jgi:hypothetical protein